MRVIILAGGSGLRLWPLSTPEMPKQFLEIGTQGSFLQMTLERALGLCSPEEVFIVTSQKYYTCTRQHTQPLDPEGRVHILCEPEAKNTAGAIAFALSYARGQGLGSAEDTFLVLSSDHQIAPTKVFHEHCYFAQKLARLGKIVCFGAVPTRPETGYGYLELKKDNTSSANSEGYFKCSFTEKPSLDTALTFVQSGKYLWNCGMFLFQMAAILEEFKAFFPEGYSLTQIPYQEAINEFSSLPSISFDYAIMERSTKVIAIPLKGVEWSDIGSFDELHASMAKDESQNVLVGDVTAEKSSNCFAYAGDKPIALLGVKDLNIIDTSKALLVVAKGYSQEVKGLAQKMHEPARNYETEKITLEPDESRRHSAEEASVHWLVVSGLAEVNFSGCTDKLTAGQSFFAPAKMEAFLSNQSAQMLDVIEVRLIENNETQKSYA